MKKLKIETILAVSSVLLLIITIGIFVYSINFLVDKIKMVLGQETNVPLSAIQFDIKGLKELGIGE